jgi:serine/threonine-protein kinase HipA
LILRKLTVELPGREVGVLTHESSGQFRWIPDSTWENDGQRPRLGLDFLRTPGKRSARDDLPAWFANLLPEKGSPLRNRLAASFDLKANTHSFQLIEHLGRGLTGAVAVNGEVKSEGLALAAEIDTKLATATLASFNGESPLRFSALTGMQLKVTMSMVSERLMLGAKGRGREWIVKFPGKEHPQLAEVEAATMTWAKRAGFEVPRHQVIPLERLDGLPPGWSENPAPVFAVERFDRRDDGSRVHQEDTCQSLGLGPGCKYGEGAGQGDVSYEGLIRLVFDACGEKDAQEVARRIGFMLAYGNDDAHLKNWALVWGDKVQPRLSPCYDLVSTISWPQLYGWETGQGPSLALKLGREKHFRNIDYRALEYGASKEGFSWIRKEVLEGIERSKEAWHAHDFERPERMCKAVEHHWTQVPLLKGLGLRRKSAFVPC